MGTWYMESRSDAAALGLGLDLGIRLIDTAEMYGEGRAEELVGEAIAGRRDEAFLVSKVYPHNASRKGAAAACERSLQRLKTDRIDLYLLHWRGDVPFAETVEAFEALQRGGQDPPLGREQPRHRRHGGAVEAPAAAQCRQTSCSTTSTRRGIEWDLLPWLRERRIPTMAYSPIEQARLLKNRALGDFARRHGMTPAQAALAWLLLEGRRHRHPQSGGRGAPEGEPGRAGNTR